MKRLVLALLLSCSGDPVRDARIEALGGEAPDVPVGPEHRAGQPCLVCHSEGGPAANKAFAIAGTVYQSSQPGAPGAEGLFVQFVDARGGAPIEAPQTGPSGNFYVPLQDWTDLAYPVRVAIYRDLDGAPVATMQSLIGREGSCNYCHRPNVADPDDAQKEAGRSSAGQIFAGTQ